MGVTPHGKQEPARGRHPSSGVVAVVVVRSSGRKARIELAGAAGGFAVAKPASDVRERTLVPP